MPFLQGNPKRRHVAALHINETECAPARFFRTALLISLALLAFCASAVFIVDPFLRYRKPSFFKPLYTSANSRQMIPGVLRHFDYDAVIVGNSQSQNLPLAALRETLGWNAVKATSPACSPRAIGQFLDIAFTARGDSIANVWVGVNVASYAGTLDFKNDDAHAYLYDATHWRDYQYLLDYDVIYQRVPKSLYATFGGGKKHYAPRTNPDNMFMLDHDGETKRVFGERHVRSDFQNDLAAGARKHSPINVNARMDDVASHLIRHAREHPRASFHIVLAPMTSLAWFQFAQNNQLDGVLAFLAAMLNALVTEPNIRIIDALSDTALATDLSLFRDTVHFSPAVDALLIAAVRDRSRDITANDIPALLDRLRELARPETQPDWIL